MKALVLGGFLGSGKTTAIIALARAIISKSNHELPVAILENEVGEVGVDDKILRAGGYAVSELFSGCACCTLAGQLPPAVKSIQDDLDPEWMIVEPTGLAQPLRIKESIEDYNHVPTRISTLVDAKRWRKMLEPLRLVLRGQLEGAENILVNKADLVDKDELDYVSSTVREFNPDASIWPICARDGIDDALVDKILGQ